MGTRSLGMERHLAGGGWGRNGFLLGEGWGLLGDGWSSLGDGWDSLGEGHCADLEIRQETISRC